MFGKKTSLAVVLMLGIAAILAILHLQAGATQSTNAQLSLAQVKVELNALQVAPFHANAKTGGSPVLARRQMDTAMAAITHDLAALEDDSPPRALEGILTPLNADYTALEQIYRMGAYGNSYGPEADVLASEADRSATQVGRLLNAASRAYSQRAASAQAKVTAGSIAAITVLLAAFAFFFLRSSAAHATAERLARENERLLAASREEALTDALTGLPNRRALVHDLSVLFGVDREASVPHMLGLFDLDGFKLYNDTFGHPAGDGLLTRLGHRLAEAMSGHAKAYRMGGDEFCVLMPFGTDDADPFVTADLAAKALSEAGDGVAIECSYGTASIPAEAQSMEQALRLVDHRLYERKTGRSSASRQSTDVLVQVLRERGSDLHGHLTEVAQLAALTARTMHLPHHEVKRIELAAELHDVGQSAIPDAILTKPGPLDQSERDVMRRHPRIGERIVRAAPSLARTADLVRASHERYDGTGYPDGIPGPAIPLGARIIGVCDAYVRMTTEQPYQPAVSTSEALAELRRCAGTQFDPGIVDVVCDLVGRHGHHAAAA
jgi:two-component system, cell cycle response regulator